MKKVNITANSPVHGVYITPLIGRYLNKEMNEDQIYRCLVGGAKVEEILPNNTIVPLTFQNYNKDNGGKIELDLSKINVPPVKIEPVKEKVEELVPDESISITSEEKVEELVPDESISITSEEKQEEVESVEEQVEEVVTKTVEEKKEDVKDIVKPQININNNRRQHKK